MLAVEGRVYVGGVCQECGCDRQRFLVSRYCEVHWRAFQQRTAAAYGRTPVPYPAVPRARAARAPAPQRPAKARVARSHGPAHVVSETYAVNFRETYGDDAYYLDAIRLYMGPDPSERDEVDVST